MISETKLKAIKSKVPIMLVMLSVILPSSNTFAVANKWEKETVDDGKITVQWSISKNNQSFPQIEYVASSVVQADMQKMIAVLKDVENHKIFNDDRDSKMLNELSRNEWDIYYLSKAPWPLSPSETFAKMILEEDTGRKKALFKINIDAQKKHPRKENTHLMTDMNVTYTFIDVGGGNIEISIQSRSVAPIKVPAWMINAYFPDGPADTITKIVELSQRKPNKPDVR